MAGKSEVITGEAFSDIICQEGRGHIKLFQEKDYICIDKKQARELALVLSKFASDDEVM